MSTLWTPSGEYAPKNSQDPDPEATSLEPDLPLRSGETVNSSEEEQELKELQAQLANTPADVIIANHCYGLFELGALYLSQNPPRLQEAQLAIDGLSSLVDGLKGRLGEAETPLREALSQIRLGYVQIQASLSSNTESSDSTDGTGLN